MVDSSSAVSWHLNGTEIGLDLLDVTAAEWRALRLASGLRQHDLLHMALREKDIEAVAALLWLALARSNEGLAYDDVLNAVTLRSLQPPEEVAVDGES